MKLLIFSITLLFVSSCSLFQDKDKELVEAVEKYEIDKVIELIKSGANPNQHTKLNGCLTTYILSRANVGMKLQSAANKSTNNFVFTYEGKEYLTKKWKNWEKEKYERALFYMYKNGGGDCTDLFSDKKSQQKLKKVQEANEKDGYDTMPFPK